MNSRGRARSRSVLALTVCALGLSACSTSIPECTLIGMPDGVVVDQTGLPPRVSGQVCLAGGACVTVPTQEEPVLLPLLPLPAQPATVPVEVRLSGRAVERLSVTLRAGYPNGRDCGPAGYQAQVRLTSGATQVS